MLFESAGQILETSYDEILSYRDRGDHTGAAPTYDYGWKSEEYLLLGDPNRGAGEPMIASIRQIRRTSIVQLSI